MFFRKMTSAALLFENLSMDTAKARKRLGVIIQGVAMNVSAPLFSLFISWMVIHLQNARLWGEFVKVQAWVLIAVQFFG